ncbi:hypothetical protein BGW42_004457 [Actinomortierella wolfii]|nr:hypothetical protein BGW42_004457 [Actinomortierella wolfii]
MIPPQKSAASETAEDIAKKDILRMMWIFKNVAPPMTLALSSSYVYLLYQGRISADVQPWHYAAVAVGVVATLFRWWSFRELDRYFTFDLKIMDDHKLIGTGPYKYLRHPSYLGLMAAGTAYYTFLIHQGFWDALIAPRIHRDSYGLAVAAYWWFAYQFSLRPRIIAEELMMESHFQDAWRDFAKRRWRLIPFLY